MRTSRAALVAVAVLALTACAADRPSTVAAPAAEAPSSAPPAQEQVASDAPVPSSCPMITHDDELAALSTVHTETVRSAPRTVFTAVAPTGPPSGQGQDSYSRCETTVTVDPEGVTQDVTLISVIWTRDSGTIARFTAGAGPAPAASATTTPVAPTAPFTAARFSPTFLGLETWDGGLYARVYVATPDSQLVARQALSEDLAARVAARQPSG